VRKRLQVYRRQTRPLIAYYRRLARSRVPGAPKYRKISGLGRVESITRRALAVLT
jgi:adenylate kinase